MRQVAHRASVRRWILRCPPAATTSWQHRCHARRRRRAGATRGLGL